MRRLERTSVFTKDLRSLPLGVQKEVWKVVCILCEDVFDKRLAIKKLEGYKKVWRVSFKKFYRLVYTFDRECVYLLRVRHRKEIYREEVGL